MGLKVLKNNTNSKLNTPLTTHNMLLYTPKPGTKRPQFHSKNNKKKKKSNLIQYSIQLSVGSVRDFLNHSAFPFPFPFPCLPTNLSLSSALTVLSPTPLVPPPPIFSLFLNPRLYFWLFLPFYYSLILAFFLPNLLVRAVAMQYQ